MRTNNLSEILAGRPVRPQQLCLQVFPFAYVFLTSSCRLSVSFDGHSMVFCMLAMVLVGLTISFLSGAESAACPIGTVAMNVASAADIEILTDILNCTVRGDFDVTWHSNQTLAQRIEVSNMKNVTVTGSGNHTIHGGLGDDNDGGAVIHAGGGTGIFSVSDGSKLTLTNVVLAGGNASRGGAVELVSDSSLFVYDCSFTSNYASDGGEILCLLYSKEELSYGPRRPL